MIGILFDVVGGSILLLSGVAVWQRYDGPLPGCMGRGPGDGNPQAISSPLGAK
jgi:hypothetical protein